MIFNALKLKLSLGYKIVVGVYLFIALDDANHLMVLSSLRSCVKVQNFQNPELKNIRISNLLYAFKTLKILSLMIKYL